MNLHFSIPYRAKWGEDVCVKLTLLGTRGREVAQLLRMETQDGNVWHTDYRVMESGIVRFRYAYAIYAGAEMVRREWRQVPRLFDADAGREFILDDFWMEIPPQPWLFSDDFIPQSARARRGDLHTPTFAQTIVLRVLAPSLAEGEAVALIGSQPPLGDWKPGRALRLSAVGQCEWRLAVSATALQLPFEYKYVIVDERTGELLRWEAGDNRVCLPSALLTPELVAKAGSVVKISNRRLLTIVRNDGIVRQRRDDELPGDNAAPAGTDAAVPAGTDAAVAAGQMSPLEMLLVAAQEMGVAAISRELLEDVAELMPGRG